VTTPKFNNHSAAASKDRRRFTFKEWLEVRWLCLVNLAFRKAKDKHKAYYEYRLAKRHFHPF